jgi:CBS domain containing-hemolysin-like protein
MTLAWAGLALLFLAAAGFYSGTEMGLYSLNRLRLRLRVGRSGDSRARTLLELSNRREQSVLAILLAQNVMNYLLTVATVALILRATHLGPNEADLYAAVILSPITFVFGDVVPKNWFQSQANRLMYPAAPLVRVCVLVFRYTGILWVLELITRRLAEWSGQEPGVTWRTARGEVIGLLRETTAEGTLTEEQTRMIERVMNLSNVRVGNIMIPRDHVIGIPAGADRKSFERIVRSHDFSRMPVLAGDRRTVLGVVNVYDVLADEPAAPIDGHFRPVVTIPARASAMQALLQLRQVREAMGIVMDPRRGWVGIVTLKDLVEEIFGELAAW